MFRILLCGNTGTAVPVEPGVAVCSREPFHFVIQVLYYKHEILYYKNVLLHMACFHAVLQ